MTEPENGIRPSASSGRHATAGWDYDVAISGGGVVGLTMAAALAPAGIRVAVIDRMAFEAMTVPAFDGRTFAIAAGSRRLLERLGVWTALASEAEPILEIRVSDDASPLFLHYDHRDVGEGPLGHIVESRHLRQGLLRHLEGLETVALIGGTSVNRCEPDATGAVLSLSGGRTLRAALAVGADGRGSPLRQAAGIGVTEWRYDQVGIVCTVGHERPHRGIAHERFLPAGPFAILPMTGNRSSIVWTEHAALAPALLALPAAAFKAELERRFGDFLGALSVVGPVFSYPLALSHAERYIAPRLALIGDAAHAIHPIAGQGLNLGLRDVAALAEVLADGCALGLDPGSAERLERYARWRRFDNALMLAMTDGLNRLFSNDVAPVRLARDAGLAAVDRMPALKRFFMRHAMGLTGDLPRLMRGD